MCIRDRDLTTRRVKVASTLDQADDAEVAAMAPEQARKYWAEYTEQNDGVEPDPAERADPGQLQALISKLDADVVPYGDFAVLRPFGKRMERAVKFAAQQWDPVTCTYVRKEIPGVNNIVEWRRSWKLYTYMMKVLKATKGPRMDRYAAKFEKLYEKYGSLDGVEGDTWWLPALGDIRMRSERFEFLRGRAEIQYEKDKKAGVELSLIHI